MSRLRAAALRNFLPIPRWSPGRCEGGPGSSRESRALAAAVVRHFSFGDVWAAESWLCGGRQRAGAGTPRTSFPGRAGGRAGGRASERAQAGREREQVRTPRGSCAETSAMTVARDPVPKPSPCDLSYVPHLHVVTRLQRDGFRLNRNGLTSSRLGIFSPRGAPSRVRC